MHNKPTLLLLGLITLALALNAYQHDKTHKIDRLQSEVLHTTAEFTKVMAENVRLQHELMDELTTDFRDLTATVDMIDFELTDLKTKAVIWEKVQ